MELSHHYSHRGQFADQILEKPINPPLSSEEGVETIDVTNFIQERINLLKSQDLYSNIDIKLISPNEFAAVHISREWFRRGIDILINNSIDAMVDSQTKRLTIRVSVIAQQITIEVEDTGHGIPPNIIPLIFVQSIPRKEGKKGLGLGLLIAQFIFYTYGGDLKLIATNSQGSTFAIMLPKLNKK